MSEQNEAAYCPFKGRCEHPECLLDVGQCASALMASARATPPTTETTAGQGGVG